jgi:uncharacterized membrane protein YqiK
MEMLFSQFVQFTPEMILHLIVYAIGVVLALLTTYTLLGIRYIPNRAVGIVEKLWSSAGPVAEGRLIVLDREAGFRASVLRGGVYFLYWLWQYRIHKVPLTIIPQGKIGYVFARDGEPLRPEQTLGRVVPCNNFQDAKSFLTGGRNPEGRGQRGRQRAILREGVYAINLAQFVVITEDNTYCLPLGGKDDLRAFETWKKELVRIRAFDPIVVGSARQSGDDDLDGTTVPMNDNIGILTVHDGQALGPGEIIAPAVGTNPADPHYHNNYQDIEAFLAAGGRRGRQLVPLADGTYFINRWFATVELIPKTLVPIGFVGVVVSYYGKQGQDLSGAAFRHGERVAEGDRGVLINTLCPGKYPFNTYAGHVHLVPTTNFVLHWITGRSEAHKYDESLKSIDLVTADAYEPELPLSVVVHIDYEKAPSVVQRFGDIKKLITQTLDPMLSAYFRDIAHKKNMLELLHDRDVIQQESRKELRARFQEFDIELVDVLIGKPDTTEKNSKIETLLEQLRLRQLSREQITTFQAQGQAAEKLQALKMAEAKAAKQTELTNSQMEIQINENRGSAELAKARMQAEQTVVTAEAENKRRLLLADAESRSNALLGEGQSKRTSLEGGAEAAVLRQKIESFTDPKLYALSIIAQHLSRSQQPLVPERLFVTGAYGEDGAATTGTGLLGTLIGILAADKAGFVDAAKPNGHGPTIDSQAVDVRPECGTDKGC